VASPLHGGTFVLDAHTGAPCKADKAHFTVALEVKASPDTTEEKIRCLLLVAGAKGARCLADFGDERIARVDWGHKAGTVLRAQVVERNGNGIQTFDLDASDKVSLQDLAHLLCSMTGTRHSCILSRRWNTSTRYHCPLLHLCKCPMRSHSSPIIGH
jgi:hypothetical protein